MNLAQRVWEAGGVDQARLLLDRHRPKPGESDLRDFEWYFLDRLCRAELFTLRHPQAVYSVAYSPDGKRLASGSWGGPMAPSEVRVWDAQTGQKLLSLQGHRDPIWSVAYSPDGKRLASAAHEEVKVWDAQTGQELLSLKHIGFITNIAFSPDGKRLASCGGTRDANRKASVAGSLKVWDVQTGQEIIALKGHTDRVISVAFSPDGKRLASASNDKTLKVWDAQTGKALLYLKAHTGTQALGGGNYVAFSPDGKRLASASDEKTVTVWDAQTGREVLTIKGGYTSVAFSPDGNRLASASDRGVKVWDAQTGEELLSLKAHTGRGIFGGGNCVAYSPDGKRLASCGDRTVKLWDAQKTIQEPLTGYDQKLWLAG
jgi:WD40 repeat protein